MKYAPSDPSVLLSITYGSRLYGTDTPTSDYDFKAITIPSHRDLILAKALKVQRFRFDADGNSVSDSQTMPDNGYEAEHTPIQKFVHDYLGGQAYAVEFVFAVLSGAQLSCESTNPRRSAAFVNLCAVLADKYRHQNVAGMIGFAVKQTFDYVRRGERLLAAQAVLAEVTALQSIDKSALRLDSIVMHAPAIEHLSQKCGLRVTNIENNGKSMRALELNGRSYLETTALTHFASAVQKLIDQYGDRSTAASKTDVDWKSLSHAVRVYEQVLELLCTGFITFPRPNAADLLQIRLGRRDIEQVKQQLRELDDCVTLAIESTNLPKVDQCMRAEVDELLYQWISAEFSEQQHV